MTNAEKFKTVEERNKAFSSFCKAGDNGCKKCQLKAESMDHCSFLWLELEAEPEENPMPCPYCGSDCPVIDNGGFWFVQCSNEDCLYSAKLTPTKDEAISAHNRVCKAVAAYNESEVK